jgi:hypothetical protein
MTRYTARREKKMRLTTYQKKYTTQYSPESYENITLSSLPSKMLSYTRNKRKIKKINETVDQRRYMTFTQNCIFYFIPSPHGVTARSGPGHPQC